jgi:uncharacterized phosphosugar-binding protein
VTPPAHESYLAVIQERFDRIRQKQADHLAEATERCAESIGSGRIAWVFGAGHSQMMAMEAYPRIGGVLGFVPMVELSLLYFTNVVGSGGLEQTIYLERVPGFAEAILRSHDPRPGDTLVVFSGSGVEVLPLEMAKGARERGLSVVAVTGLEYSRAAAERRGLDEILADRADVVIDSGLPVGDAALDLEGVDGRVGPTSTVLHTAIMDCLAVDTAQALAARGTPPYVFASPHLVGDGYDAYRDALHRFRRLVSRADLDDEGR